MTGRERKLREEPRLGVLATTVGGAARTLSPNRLIGVLGLRFLGPLPLVVDFQRKTLPPPPSSQVGGRKFWSDCNGSQAVRGGAVHVGPGDPLWEEKAKPLESSKLQMNPSEPARLFLPFPNAPPIKAVTPHRDERKPQLKERTTSRDITLYPPSFPPSGD